MAPLVAIRLWRSVTTPSSCKCVSQESLSVYTWSSANKASLRGQLLVVHIGAGCGVNHI